MDCFTIALGKKTGTTFPITFDNKHNYNALYDTGAGASLINYSAYVSLGQDLDTGYLILIKDNTAKSFEPLYKGNYRVVKVHGNNVEIRDYRGNISMVHVTDVKKITLMEQVADEYEKLGKEGRFSKKCIPRGYIPDFDWTTIHPSQDQPIKPIKQQDPTEDTTTPAAPTEVEGPPSSHLRSKTKQQPTSDKQG